MFSSNAYGKFTDHDRGRGRGRGGHSAARRGGGQAWRSSAPETPRSRSPPIGPVLTTILHNELVTDQTSGVKAKITDLEDITSYNWVKADEPTIVTPGKPPKWTPMARPTRLKEDNPNGTYYRDPNAAYFPSYPMEPVIRSIFESCPDFNGQEVDLFGCGSTLGNLLNFARNVETEKSFRFLVEVVGETVFLIRRGHSPKEQLTDVRGFGHSFPEANTTWDFDVRNSNTHQRIVRYRLGGLNTMIRFEADGYLAEDIPVKDLETNANLADQKVDEDFHMSALERNTVSMHLPKYSDSLNVNWGRDSVPQSAVFDLKTRSVKKKAGDTTIADQIPLLWIRQIPIFILAYHERGLFRSEEVTVRNIRPDTARWERENEGDVRRLIDLVEKIANVVKTAPRRKLEVVYRGGLRLELMEQVEGITSVLPSSLAARWIKQGNRAGPTDIAVEDLHADSAEDPSSSSLEDGALSADDASDDGECDWDGEEDYTACSAESCGYCGHCSY